MSKWNNIKVAVSNINDDSRRHTEPISNRNYQQYPRLGKQTTFGRITHRLKQKHHSTKTIVYFIIVFLLCFLVMFIIWFNVYPESFGLNKDSLVSSKTVDGIYYFSTVTSTVGFGDICPKTKASKIMTSIYQMFLFVLSLGALWKITDGKLKDIVNKVAQRASVSESSDENHVKIN